MNDKVKGEKKVYFGTRKEDGRTIYITKPTWDCGWYWGFGYLGNVHEHYHLNDYQKKDYIGSADNKSFFKVITVHRNINMHDALLEDYDLNPNIKKYLWLFCELVQTAYTLKETAEVLGRGGSHYTKNPLSEIIKNEDEVKRINEIVLPAIFNKLNDIYKDEV